MYNIMYNVVYGCWVSDQWQFDVVLLYILQLSLLVEYRKLPYFELWNLNFWFYQTTVNGPATFNANKWNMAYFEPRVYRALNAGPLRFDIMKFCCIEDIRRRWLAWTTLKYNSVLFWFIVCIKRLTNSDERTFFLEMSGYAEVSPINGDNDEWF